MKIESILYTFQKNLLTKRLTYYQSLKKTNLTMYLLKILTDKCFQEQNIKAKNTIAGLAYKVLL